MLNHEKDEILNNCRECGICENHCFFLETYGNPKKITEDNLNKACLNCTLCGLCTKVCPFDLDPLSFFLNQKEEYFRNHNPYKTHKNFLKYESFGYSKIATLYYIPEKAHSVFFPGCNFSGSRSENLLKIYKELNNKSITGLILDCCGTPSESLGLAENRSKLEKTLKFLKDHNISKIYFACPNCYRAFQKINSEIKCEMVISFFYENKYRFKKKIDNSKFYLHDPCVLRNEKDIQDQIRMLLKENNTDYFESEFSREKTLCCGGGAGLYEYNRELSLKWKNKIISLAGGRKILTYCAGCQNSLGKNSTHIMDLFFEDTKIDSSIFTYLKRILLKRSFLKKDNGIKAVRVGDKIEPV